MTALLDVPLPRRLRRLPVVPWVHGRLASRAWSWDLRDQWTRQWWPQGITWAGSLLLVSWYARSGGSRVSVVDVAAGRYGHLTLQRPDGAALRVHAGGLAWVDGWLYVAATAKGFWSLHVDDLDAPRGRWPARQLHRPDPPGSSSPFRWSFLDAGQLPTHLYAGEYGRGRQSTRLGRLPLLAGLPAGNIELLGDGPPGMQGVAPSETGLLVATSHGPWARGTLCRVEMAQRSPSPVEPPEPPRSLVEPPEPRSLVEPAERQRGRVETRRPHALPIGVEDLTRDADGSLWTPAEHPGRRAIICLAPR